MFNESNKLMEERKKQIAVATKELTDIGEYVREIKKESRILWK